MSSIVGTSTSTALLSLFPTLMKLLVLLMVEFLDYLIKTTCSSTLKLLFYNDNYQRTDDSLNHNV
jgi:hypothetical protein